MKLDRLEQRVMRDEGFRASAYQDTVGVWTLGYGSTKMNGVPVKDLDTCTKQHARVQLRADLYQSIIDCHKLFPNWEQHNDVRQEVLVNMMYNLGMTRLSGFKKMRAGLETQNYRFASEEMVNSKWYKQVGGRGQRLVAAMKAGEWMEESK